MKFAFTLLATLATLASFSQLKELKVVEVENNGTVPGTTYRIYAVVESDSTQIVAVYGEAGSEMKVTTTTSFYQSPIGGESSSNLNRKLLKDNEELKYDSYVTLGDMDNYQNKCNTSTIDLSDFEEGNNIESVDGVYYALPYSKQCYPDERGRVLLMQLTTTGKVEGKINILGRHVISDRITDQGFKEFESWNELGLTFVCE